MSLGLNCIASHVNVLRRTPGGCKEASRQKNQTYLHVMTVFFAKKNKNGILFRKQEKEDLQKENIPKTSKRFLSNFC